MRRSIVFLVVTAVQIALFAVLALHAHLDREASLRSCIKLVEARRLSDLCLFTEARYTRHPAMADHHAAFQDHPTALEHFPSGTLVAPPQRRHGP